MAQEIGALRALLTATSAVFEKDMKAARDSVRKHGNSMQQSLSEIGKKFGNATVMLGKYAAAAGAAAATGFAIFIKKQIDAADKIGKVAQATGQTTEFISSMGYVAEQTGTSIDSIAQGMKILSRNMLDTSKGTGEAKIAFEDLGVSVADSSGSLRTSEAVLMELADKLSNLPDSAEKSALAMKLFGKSGTDLIPMLNGGSAGIEALQKQAKEMGLVISSETANQAAYFNDELNRLKNEAVGAGRAIMVDMLPGLVQAVKDIRAAKEESGLLTAAWVALGAGAKAVFSKSTAGEIKQINKEIQNTEEHIAKLQERSAGRSMLRPGTFLDKKDIEESKKHLEFLIQKREEYIWTLDKEKAAEKARIEASIAAAQAEEEAKDKALKAMRESARVKQEQAEFDAKAKAEAQAQIKAAEAAQKAIQSTIKSLELERDTFGMTEEAATLYRISLMDGITPAQLELAESILDTIKAQQEQQKITDEGKQVFDSTRTAVEKYAIAIARLRQLLAAGAIDQETFERAMEDARKALEGTTDKGKEGFEELQRAIEGWGRQSSKAIVDFALDGKKSFSDLAKSIIRDILEMMVYQNMMKPLLGSISSGIGGLGSLFSGGGYVPSAYGMANGGVIAEPIFGVGASGQTYTFGEGGKHEAVIPLDGSGSVGSKDVSVTAVVNISAIDTRSGMEFIKSNGPTIAASLVDQMKHDPTFSRFVRS